MRLFSEFVQQNVYFSCCQGKNAIASGPQSGMLKVLLINFGAVFFLKFFLDAAQTLSFQVEFCKFLLEERSPKSVGLKDPALNFPLLGLRQFLINYVHKLRSPCFQHHCPVQIQNITVKDRFSFQLETGLKTSKECLLVF